LSRKQQVLKGVFILVLIPLVVGVIADLIAPGVLALHHHDHPTATSTATTTNQSPSVTTSAPTVPSSAYLVDLPIEGGDRPDIPGVAMIGQQSFQHSLTYFARHGITGPGAGASSATTYSLGKHYHRFQASVGVADNPGYTVEFDVYVDGKRASETPVDGAGPPIPITVDVTGASQLQIKVSLVSVITYIYDTSMIWGEAQLLS